MKSLISRKGREEKDCLQIEVDVQERSKSILSAALKVHYYYESKCEVGCSSSSKSVNEVIIKLNKKANSDALPISSLAVEKNIQHALHRGRGLESLIPIHTLLWAIPAGLST